MSGVDEMRSRLRELEFKNDYWEERARAAEEENDELKLRVQELEEQFAKRDDDHET